MEAHSANNHLLPAILLFSISEAEQKNYHAALMKHIHDGIVSTMQKLISVEVNHVKKTSGCFKMPKRNMRQLLYLQYRMVI